MAERATTDFPEPGGTRRVSLRASAFRAFDLRFALDLKNNWPEIWHLSNDGDALFCRLMPVQRRGGSIRSPDEEAAVRERETWAAAHHREVSLAGVVAQIKRLVVGDQGIDRMKTLVNNEKDRVLADRDHRHRQRM